MGRLARCSSHGVLGWVSFSLDKRAECLQLNVLIKSRMFSFFWLLKLHGNNDDFKTQWLKVSMLVSSSKGHMSVYGHTETPVAQL